MSKYICPHCRGGFPELEAGACPWCGEPMSGEWERPAGIISRVEGDSGSEEDEGDLGLIGRKFFR